MGCFLLSFCLQFLSPCCPCESGVLKEACEGDAQRGKSELLLIVQCKPFLHLVLPMGELFSRFVTRVFMGPSFLTGGRYGALKQEPKFQIPLLSDSDLGGPALLGGLKPPFPHESSLLLLDS